MGAVGVKADIVCACGAQGFDVGKMCIRDSLSVHLHQFPHIAVCNYFIVLVVHSRADIDIFLFEHLSGHFPHHGDGVAHIDRLIKGQLLINGCLLYKSISTVRFLSAGCPPDAAA